MNNDWKLESTWNGYLKQKVLNYKNVMLNYLVLLLKMLEFDKKKSKYFLTFLKLKKTIN